MTKELDEKFFDIRIRENHLNKGVISRSHVDEYLKKLPNDENNFELVMITEDEIGLGSELTEDEIKAMPEITEENIDSFDFDEEEASETDSETKD